MVFCNKKGELLCIKTEKVTILILIDGFLQYKVSSWLHIKFVGHNPYFNRWFSAIQNEMYSDVNMGSHNPYFNRWFSAI